MQKFTAIIALLLVACISGIASASEASIKAEMQKKYPQIPVEAVNKTPLPGIYEVYANGQIIYTDEKVGYLFVNGSMIDAEKKINLTEERMNRLTAIKFEQLPLNLAFKKVKGKGTRKLAYFGDPNCGFCKKFDQELAKIDDVTIYMFLYPVLGPDSVAKAKSIWCSKDRVKAWDDQMLNGIAPTAAGTCDTPVEKIVAFGQQKNISGTPTMFFSDGQRVPGMISTDQVEQRLAAAAKSK
jgi:thiol:disulfide interchange protein DsbC